jgi:hypothetical protein
VMIPARYHLHTVTLEVNAIFLYLQPQPLLIAFTRTHAFTPGCPMTKTKSSPNGVWCGTPCWGWEWGSWDDEAANGVRSHFTGFLHTYARAHSYRPRVRPRSLTRCCVRGGDLTRFPPCCHAPRVNTTVCSFSGNSTFLPRVTRTTSMPTPGKASGTRPQGLCTTPEPLQVDTLPVSARVCGGAPACGHTCIGVAEGFRRYWFVAIMGGG